MSLVNLILCLYINSNFLSQTQALFEYFSSQAQALMIKARRFIELPVKLDLSFTRLRPYLKYSWVEV